MVELTSVGKLIGGGLDDVATAHSGAVPIRPITDDFITVIGAGPVAISITSTPCRKDAAIWIHRRLDTRRAC